MVNVSIIKKLSLGLISYSLLDVNVWIGSLILRIIKSCRSSWRSLSLIRIRSINCSASSSIAVLRPATDACAYGPVYVGGSIDRRTQITLGVVNFRLFSNGLVNIRSSSVLLRSANTLFIEQIDANDQAFINYSGGHVNWHGVNNCLVSNFPLEKIDRGIFLGGNGSWNYYHWMIEILPKCSYFTELPDGISKYPLLVSEDVLKTPSFQETLNIAAPGYKVIYLSSEKNYCVGNLAWIDAPNQLPFNLRANLKFQILHARMRPESIRYLRELYISDSTSQYHKPIRVFLIRKTIRRNYNQKEIGEMLAKYGFLACDMESLTFAEQVATFNNAEWIVGPTGAAWTNIVFSGKGTKSLCWMAYQYGDFSAFSSLAGVVGAKFYYLGYEAPVASTGDLYRTDYVLDVNKLEVALLALGIKN